MEGGRTEERKKKRNSKQCKKGRKEEKWEEEGEGGREGLRSWFNVVLSNGCLCSFSVFLLSAACKEAREKRKVRKISTGDKVTSPNPRPGTDTDLKRSRELEAVAKYEKQIRPGKYVDTFRFRRQGWARKEVVVNPFMYGAGQELVAINTSPLAADELDSSPVKSSPDKNANSSPVPASLSSLFDASPSPEAKQVDGTPTDRLQRSTPSPMDPEDSGSLGETPEGAIESPRRKEWAKQKAVEKKAAQSKRSKAQGSFHFS